MIAPDNGALSEKLFNVYTEMESVRRRNAYLEIRLREIEATLHEKDIEHRYQNDRLEKELNSIIQERDDAMRRMQDEVNTAQMQLAEERQRRADELRREREYANVQAQALPVKF